MNSAIRNTITRANFSQKTKFTYRFDTCPVLDPSSGRYISNDKEDLHHRQVNALLVYISADSTSCSFLSKAILKSIEQIQNSLSTIHLHRMRRMRNPTEKVHCVGSECIMDGGYSELRRYCGKNTHC
jgi:hypothetical protein